MKENDFQHAEYFEDLIASLPETYGKIWLWTVTCYDGRSSITIELHNLVTRWLAQTSFLAREEVIDEEISQHNLLFASTAQVLHGYTTHEQSRTTVALIASAAGTRQ